MCLIHISKSHDGRGASETVRGRATAREGVLVSCLRAACRIVRQIEGRRCSPADRERVLALYAVDVRGLPWAIEPAAEGESS